MTPEQENPSMDQLHNIYYKYKYIYIYIGHLGDRGGKALPLAALLPPLRLSHTKTSAPNTCDGSARKVPSWGEPMHCFTDELLAVDSGCCIDGTMSLASSCLSTGKSLGRACNAVDRCTHQCSPEPPKSIVSGLNPLILRGTYMAVHW